MNKAVLTIKSKPLKTIDVILAGNPNVGKSTLFNMLTGQKQHTGNWTGKTIDCTNGICKHKNIHYNITDLPGTYSLKGFSPEEEVAGSSIRNMPHDIVVIVINATSLERNLPLALQILMCTRMAVLCLNMVDEAEKKNIIIDTNELSLQLGIPVVKTVAKNKVGKANLLDTIYQVVSKNRKTFTLQKLQEVKESNLNYDKKMEILSEISRSIIKHSIKNNSPSYSKRDIILDNIFMSKLTGIPMMLILFFLVFWLTAYGANYPGKVLTFIFDSIISFVRQTLDSIMIPKQITSIIADGMLTTTAWVVSVMLPPALIFFPLFAILEESGYLPRVAFNLDKIFHKTGTNGKLAITMLMGFGCNSCGVMGCRIIRNKKERFIATITNSFIPCNGRLPTLISLISIFFTASVVNTFTKSIVVTLILLLFLLLAIGMTLIVSFFISRHSNGSDDSGFILELPPYKKPSFLKVILNSLQEKVLFTLSRAVLVALPSGAIIWLLTNINISGYPIINYLTDFLHPLGLMLGLDGVILTAFILGFPANEIVIPIILMTYLNAGVLTGFAGPDQLGEILRTNGWTEVTALCACVFCMFHFPCSTTCITIKKETQSAKWTVLSILTPLIIGSVLCTAISFLSHIF